MSNRKALIDFLRRNFREPLIADGGEGIALDFPSFDVTPFDYLEFAERSLASKGPQGRIDCVANLKRAIECEIDTLLHAMGVTLGRKERNLPFKLSLVERMGIVRSQSLTRLNAIRNRVEHQYAQPRGLSLQIYVDLATAFVYAVEAYLFLLASTGETEWTAHSMFKHRPSERRDVDLRARYSVEEVGTVFTWHDNGASGEVRFPKAAGWDAFGFGVRLHYLITRAAHVISMDFVRRQLRDLGSA